jgi:crossover junction endodeoxyribonuclease RusA
MSSYVIRLPWPEPALWQNRKVHWARRAKATKSARKTAWALALEQKVPRIPNAILEFEFYPPTNAKRDIQNMPATQKAAIDGIADAMGCDDSEFRVRWPEAFSGVVHGGCVVVRIIPPVVQIELRGTINEKGPL